MPTVGQVMAQNIGDTGGESSGGTLTPGVTRGIPSPLHDQLREAIVQMVHARDLRPGDLLPSENQLCHDFKVSRTVVRQALAELHNDGLVRRVKGKGTFVSQPKTSERLMHTLLGLYEDVEERGGVVHSDVLEHVTAPANKDVAEQLEVAVNTAVVLLRRMRFVDGEPWALSTAWLPEAAGRHTLSADMVNDSLYRVLERHGIFGATGWRSVEAVLADEHTAHHLRTDVGSALLKLRSVRRDEMGTPIEYFEAFHRGDHSRFEFELTRDETRARVLTSAREPRGV